MRPQIKFYLLGLFSALLLFSCSPKKNIERSPLLQRNTEFILENAGENAFTYEWLSAKLSADADWGDKGGQFKVNLRIRHDSAIWMSITPALGIEAARLLITKDSIFFMDKLKKQYYKAEYEELEELTNSELPFESLENLIVGNAIEIFEADKYQSYTEEQHYILVTKNKRKVRKAIKGGKKEEYTLSSDSTFAEQVKPKKFLKATEKLDEEDLIVKRYWLMADNFRIVKTLVDDLKEKSSMLVEYSDHFAVASQLLPGKAIITLSAPDQNALFKFEYLRAETGEVLTFPFMIPSKYAPFE